MKRSIFLIKTSRALIFVFGAHFLPIEGFSQESDRPLSEEWVGYTKFRTDLPGGRHANVITSRAYVVSADGSGRRQAAEALVDKPNVWTQFSGWSPDGKRALIGRGWESPENAAWEEEHQTFRMTQGWLYDTFLFDMETDELFNVTAVDRVSNYNTGLFFWPGDPDRLGFQALIEGQSNPFSMRIDGRKKVDLTRDSDEFAYGFSASPDGRRIAYHKNYQIYLADFDGGNAMKIDTGNPFNFVPEWSPDGEWILYVSGEHYDCHPHVVRRDGTGFRKIADRGGYRGVVTFLDVPDFHGGSSDVPAWSRDGKWVYFTSKTGEIVELMRASLEGIIERLTQSPSGSLNYHPTASPDGEWILFGSTRTGRRQLHVIPAGGGEPQAITSVPEGYGAMWGHWRPQ